MEVKLGDEVHVLLPKHRAHNGVHAGRVTKTGRKYATAEYTVTYAGHDGEPQSSTRTIEFSMETGFERNPASNFRARVQSPGETEQQARMDKARETLFKAGVSVSGDWGRVTIEQWEALAAVAATFPEYVRR